MTRALLSYMMDLHVEHGYEEAWPPAIVRRAALVGTGQLPKFAEPTCSSSTLAGRARSRRRQRPVPVVDGGGPDHQPPHGPDPRRRQPAAPRTAAYAACFRAEAGSAGRDTRGLIRQHQFDKVELVKIATPETSFDELEKMRERRRARVAGPRAALPRRSLLCTGDMGFSSDQDLRPRGLAAGPGRVPRDLVVLELRPTSRRGAPRSATARRPSEKPRHAHTLNGSGVAIGRTRGRDLRTVPAGRRLDPSSRTRPASVHGRHGRRSKQRDRLRAFCVR